MPPAPPPTGRWRAACRARDAATGLRCRLLAPHEGSHAHERGGFVRVLLEGAAPARRIDVAVTLRNIIEVP